MHYNFPNLIDVMFVMGGLLAVVIVQVLLIGLKLFGVLLLSWWWVFSVIPICFMLFVIGIGIAEIYGKRKYAFIRHIGRPSKTGGEEHLRGSGRQPLPPSELPRNPR